MKTGTVALSITTPKFFDFLALTKPRLNSLVVITTAVGFYLASNGQVDVAVLLHTVIGSALVAGGAAAFNQVAERDLDESMERTRHRPLPGKRIRLSEARIFATALTATGVTELILVTNWLTMVIALVTLVSYVLIYTPLKRLTPWATPIGAIPGALPPMIGWTAARGEISVEAWVLFGIVFCWQLPHFYALAWMYREDFKRANIPLVAVQDTNGVRTSTHVLVCTAALLLISFAPALVELGGSLYIVGALIIGSIFLVLAVRFALDQTIVRARLLFFWSLVYLPVLWGLLMVEHVV